MSYEIFTSRRPHERKFETDGLLITDRPYWSRIHLVGKGEHEWTNLTIDRRDLYAHKWNGECELAELLDRLFMRAHATRSATPKIGGLEITGGPWFDEAPE